MTENRQPLDYVTILAPIAPAIPFGIAAYKSTLDHATQGGISDPNIATVLAIFASLASVIAIEGCGIFAGHGLSKYIVAQSYVRATGSGLILALYAVVGMTSLLGVIDPLVGLFIMIVSLYVYRGIDKSWDEEMRIASHEIALQREDDAEAARLQREDDAIEVQFNRDQAALENHNKHIERLARIDAKSNQPLRDNSGTVPGQLQTDWRLLSDPDKLRILDLTREEIVQMYGVSSKTAGRWLVNADSMSEQMSKNGSN